MLLEGWTFRICSRLRSFWIYKSRDVMRTPLSKAQWGFCTHAEYLRTFVLSHTNGTFCSNKRSSAQECGVTFPFPLLSLPLQNANILFQSELLYALVPINTPISTGRPVPHLTPFCSMLHSLTEPFQAIKIHLDAFLPRYSSQLSSAISQQQTQSQH